MTTLEDVKSFQRQGMSDDQIVERMREQGISYREISDTIAQSKIKAAVEQQDNPDTQMTESLPTPEAPPSPQQPYYAQAPEYQQQQQQQEYQVPSPGSEYTYDYSQQTPQGQVSADLISEIAEQIVAEKMSDVRRHLEKTLDLKTTMEARIEYLDERLKKIERSIDTLQTSVLKKVGDYMTNVQDIKTELIETQKTFAKVAGHHRSSPTHHTQSHQHHSGNHPVHHHKK